MALVLLEQNGRLSIEDDGRKVLPELPDYGHKITLGCAAWRSVPTVRRSLLWISTAPAIGNCDSGTSIPDSPMAPLKH